jgi:hypothetical protein
MLEYLIFGLVCFKFGAGYAWPLHSKVDLFVLYLQCTGYLWINIITWEAGELSRNSN